MSSEYHFVTVHRSNSFVSNLICVYVITSYVDIASFSKLFATAKKQQIIGIYFSKLFGIYIAILLKKLLPKVLKFSSPNFSVLINFLIFILTLKPNLLGYYETAKNLQGN